MTKFSELNVEPLIFKIFDIYFMLSCYAGLILQATQISVNYFRFDLVSDIKLTAPEDTNVPKAANVCFLTNHVIDMKKYKNITKKYSEQEYHYNQKNLYNFTLQERFDIATKPNEMFTFNGMEISFCNATLFLITHRRT